jgi:hypothetical protein
MVAQENIVVQEKIVKITLIKRRAVDPWVTPSTLETAFCF